ncbi:Protease 4, partial [Haemophilus influenzae]
KGSVIIEKGQN